MSIICPTCGSTDIAACEGGTCYRPSKEAMRKIKYICTDCLYEFGPSDLKKVWNKPLKIGQEGIDKRD